MLDQGTFEEWWAGEKRYKLILTSTKTQQVVYGTDHGRFAQKADARLPIAFGSIETLAEWPLTPIGPEALSRMRLSRVPFHAGEITLDCVVEEFLSPQGKVMQIVSDSGEEQAETAHVCFDPGTAILRATSDAYGNTTFNALALFEGQYVARTINHSDSSGESLEIGVDKLESVDSVETSDLAPPPDTALVPYARRMTVPSGVMSIYRSKGDNPQYPGIAKAARVQGTVALHALIRDDGTVADLQVISGPPMLQEAVRQAIWTWRYKPYLLGAEPVAVDTQIYVTFQVRAENPGWLP